MGILHDPNAAGKLTAYGAEVVGSSDRFATIFCKLRAVLDELDDFEGRSNLLLSDLERCYTPLRRNPKNPFWRRLFIRNLFALIEGQLFGLKRMAYHLSQQCAVNFTAAEMAMLQEHRFKLDHKGNAIQSEDNYPPLLGNYRFAVKAFATANRSSFQLDETRIAQLGDLEKVRHSLVHPKKLASLNISDAHIQSARTVANWHLGELGRLLRECPPARLQFRDIQESFQSLEISRPCGWVVIWPDGTLYGLETRKQAERFAKAKSERHPSGMNYFITPTKRIQQSTC